MFSPAILYEHSYIDLYVFITILCELLCRQIQKCSSQALLKTLCQPLWSCPFFWRSCHLPPNFITHRKHVTLHSAVRMRSSEPFIVVPDISLRLHIILVAAYFFVCFHSYRHHARFPNDFYTPCKYIWRHDADHFFCKGNFFTAPQRSYQTSSGIGEVPYYAGYFVPKKASRVQHYLVSCKGETLRPAQKRQVRRCFGSFRGSLL